MQGREESSKPISSPMTEHQAASETAEAAPKRRLSPWATWALCTLVALALIGLVYAIAYRPGDPPVDATGTPEPPAPATVDQ